MSEEEKSEQLEEVRNGILPKFLNICEKQLEKNGTDCKFIVGNDLTIADFVLTCLTFNVLKNEMCPLSAQLGPILSNYPKFVEYTGRLHTELANHLESRAGYFF